MTNNILLEGYEVKKELGRGSYGFCYLVKEKKSANLYACKIVGKENQTEIDIHSTLNNENVVKFIISTLQCGSCYIIMELCVYGNLKGLLKCRLTLKNIEVKCVLNQIVSGLKYLHSNLIIHRDLKLSNILLDENMIAKIADFGLAIKVKNKDSVRYSLCGTHSFLAPEVIQENAYNFPVDIWGVGCIMYTLLDGEEPFQHPNGSCISDNICTSNFKETKLISKIGLDLLKKIFSINPSKRPSVFTILSHEYFTRGHSIKKLPTYIFYRPFQRENDSYQANHGSDLNNEMTNCLFSSEGVKTKNKYLQRHGKENAAVLGKIKEANKSNMVLRSQKVKKTFEFKKSGIVKSEIRPNSFSVYCDDGEDDNCLQKRTANIMISALIKFLIEKTKAHKAPLKTFHFDEIVKFQLTYVTRWVILPNKMFGYHLSDGSFSLKLEKQTYLHRKAGGEYTFYKSDGFSPTPITFNSAVVPAELRRVLSYARKVNKVLLGLERLGSISHRYKQIITVKYYELLKGKCDLFGIFMLFSNGTIQINFEDHEKIIVDATRKFVVYFSGKENECCCYRENCDVPKIIQYLLLKIIAFLVSIEDLF